MSKTRKILTVCLIVAIISTIVGIISVLRNPGVVSITMAAGPGIIAVVLSIVLISSKKDDRS